MVPEDVGPSVWVTSKLFKATPNVLRERIRQEFLFGPLGCPLMAGDPMFDSGRNVHEANWSGRIPNPKSVYQWAHRRSVVIPHAYPPAKPRRVT